MYNRIDYHENNRLSNRIYNRICNRNLLEIFLHNRNRICNRNKKKYKKYDYLIDYFHSFIKNKRRTCTTGI